MKKGESFDRWWNGQDPKPAVQKGTLRRGWRLGEAAGRRDECERIRPLLPKHSPDPRLAAILDAFDRICPEEPRSIGGA